MAVTNQCAIFVPSQQAKIKMAAFLSGQKTYTKERGRIRCAALSQRDAPAAPV